MGSQETETSQNTKSEEAIILMKQSLRPLMKYVVLKNVFEEPEHSMGIRKRASKKAIEFIITLADEMVPMFVGEPSSDLVKEKLDFLDRIRILTPEELKITEKAIAKAARDKLCRERKKLEKPLEIDEEKKPPRKKSKIPGVKPLNQRPSSKTENQLMIFQHLNSNDFLRLASIVHVIPVCEEIRQAILEKVTVDCVGEDETGVICFVCKNRVDAHYSLGCCADALKLCHPCLKNMSGHYVSATTSTKLKVGQFCCYACNRRHGYSEKDDGQVDQSYMPKKREYDYLKGCNPFFAYMWYEILACHKKTFFASRVPVQTRIAEWSNQTILNENFGVCTPTSLYMQDVARFKSANDYVIAKARQIESKGGNVAEFLADLAEKRAKKKKKAVKQEEEKQKITEEERPVEETSPGDDFTEEKVVPETPLFAEEEPVAEEEKVVPETPLFAEEPVAEQPAAEARPKRKSHEISDDEPSPKQSKVDDDDDFMEGLLASNFIEEEMRNTKVTLSSDTLSVPEPDLAAMNTEPEVAVAPPVDSPDEIDLFAQALDFQDFME